VPRDPLSPNGKGSLVVIGLACGGCGADNVAVRHYRWLFLISVAVSACATDKDPLDNSSTSGGHGLTFGSSTTSSDPLTTGAAPTEASSGGAGSSTGGGGTGHEICDLYLGCLAATHPELLPAAQMGYGPDGSCWQGTQEQVDECLTACATGLANGHDDFPDEPSCYLCFEHSECPPGERCGAHACGVPSCGDDVVDPNEACERKYDVVCHLDCSDSDLGCNPMSNVGCSADAICTMFEGGENFGCYEPDPAPKSDGEPCELVDCGPGLFCIGADQLKGCSGTRCCTRYCNLQLPDECPDGRVCAPSLGRKDFGACELH
jgi:hypothetical protein